MRKVALALAGIAALAGASVANAAVTVTSATNLNTPNPFTDSLAVQVVGTTTTINFGQNTEPNGSFDGSFTFTNPTGGLYTVLVGSSTPGVTFSSSSLVGISGTVGSYPLSGAGTNVMQLPQTLIGPGSFMFSFAGDNTNESGVVNGNITIMQAPIPEPASWAMMIIGFGAIGWTLRRRRRLALAQIA